MEASADKHASACRPKGEKGIGDAIKEGLFRTQYEIMAPVGSWESLAAAIKAGADSVYFGIEKLNMRSHSSANFTTDDLREIVRVCRENGVKTYLTVNTIIYDDDMELMREIVNVAKESGVSAIIACDIAVMQYAYSIGVEVHLSTQLNISNVEALRFYAKYADVVVLARELNLEQVKRIAEAIERDNICGPKGEKIRIEMFCHGALCMAVSGKCYLSLHETTRSANRGSCMQICRRAYTVTDSETGEQLKVDNKYIMSPKDLKTIHFMNKMVDAGVKVFKIEGRARGPEYVKTVVECYREALDSCLDGSYSDERIAAWEKRLSEVFNRGFWNGYYLGQRLGEWSSHYGSSATLRKVYIGKVTNYFKNLKVAEFTLDTQTLSNGERILVTGVTTGAYEAVAEGIRNDVGAQVEQVSKGERFSMKTTEVLHRGDKLYKMEVVEK